MKVVLLEMHRGPLFRGNYSLVETGDAEDLHEVGRVPVRVSGTVNSMSRKTRPHQKNVDFLIVVQLERDWVRLKLLLEGESNECS